MLKNDRKTKIIYIVLVCLFLLISCLSMFIFIKYDFLKLNYIDKGLAIDKINVLNYNKENDSYTLEIKLYKIVKNTKRYCYVSNDEVKPDKNTKWILSKNNSCVINDIKDVKYIYLKTDDKTTDKLLVTDYINKLLDINLSHKKIYLIVKETKNITSTPISIGSVKPMITYSSKNESIAKIDDKGLITGVGNGVTTIYVKGNNNVSEEIEVVVTNLLTLPKINNKKPFLTCKRYAQSEAKLLDEILFYQITEAGDNTRAGVVAAARFLSLEFPYRISYFLENGRLSKKGKLHVDGEGRYYHRGLYLSTDKYKAITAPRVGPRMWGCKMNELSKERYWPNGLDCSGFVSWTIKNGGFDIGDLGAAGWVKNSIDDLTSFGEEAKLTKQLLTSGKVKAGDIASIPGHAAMVIGIDQNKKMIYIAEELFDYKGLTVLSLSFDKAATNKNFTHIILMDKYYKKDGNYTSMW